MKRPEAPNFWISYSDLATGLMMVFLLMMVIFMVKAQQDAAKNNEVARESRELAARVEAEKREIAAIVQKVVAEMRVRPQLARALETRLRGRSGVAVNAVTASVTLGDEFLRFQSGKAGWDELEADDVERKQREVLGFATDYLCALFHHERGAADRVRSVHRVSIVGHADLKSAQLLGEGDNWRLTAARASTIHEKILEHIQPCSSDDGCGELPLGCPREKLWVFAQHRLVAAGAGHSRHCGAIGGNDADCTVLGRDRRWDEPAYRNVTFEVVLTDSDLTGLIGDLEKIRGIIAEQVQIGHESRAPRDGKEKPWINLGIDEIRSALTRECGARPTEGKPDGCAYIWAERAPSEPEALPR